MSTRRDALRILSATSVALPAMAAQESKEVESQPGHLHADRPVKPPVPSKPTFFQPAEFATVEAVAERIIPRTDTPGAKDAGVALLIDKAILAQPSLGYEFRAGLADLNAAAVAAYGCEFVKLSEGQQVQLLTPMSLQDDSTSGKFFKLMKDMTVDAYYRTEAGLATELGWHGNVVLTEFKGCDHPEHQA